MPSAFTHYWSESTPFEDGELFSHTAGNRFISAGVTTGDRVFGISVRRGVPILIGRMTVSRPPVNFEEARDLLPYEPWEAAEHLIAMNGSASAQSSARVIPVEILRLLRFESASGVTALKFVTETRLDQQTFRGVRRLTQESADLLESLIDYEVVISEPSEPTFPDEVTSGAVYIDGAVKQVLVNAYERDPAARRDCISHHGCACIVCGFDFGLYYGELGEGFIHVHHVQPLSEIRGEHQIDPIRDLVPVCPNCHAMLHRDNPPPTVEELTAIFETNVANINEDG